MHSLAPSYLESLRFSARQATVLRALGEYRGKQRLFVAQSPQTLTDLRQIAAIESTESSNRLEGVVVEPKRLKSLVLQHASPRSRSEQEIAGYRDALALVHEAAGDMHVSEGTIRQLHTILYSYMPQPGGTWKATNNDIIERHSDGTSRVRFRTVQAHLTPVAMAELVRTTRDTLESNLVDPLVVIPLAVLDFLCIHPFPDGNGRVARLLSLQLLYRAGYEVGRYISLERIFEESKESYYETLEASSQRWHDAEHDAGPWLDYFWGTLLRAYKEFEQRVGTIERGRGSKAERVRGCILDRTLPFSLADVERECPGISRDTIRKVMSEMKAEGLIAPQRRGPGATWVRCAS